MTNKELMTRFYKEMEAGNLGFIDESTTEDFIEHDALAPTPDRDGVRQVFTMLRASFPDMRFEITHLVGEDDVAIAHGLFEGTHEGELMGIAPTGRRISVPFADIVRFRDGLAVEHWGVFDSGMMLQQLGVVPPPGG